MTIECCGVALTEALGKYGCSNCHGENVRGKPMTPKQREMLLSYADSNEPTEYADFADKAGAALGYLDADGITALHSRGYLDADGITEAGRKALGQ